MRQLVVGTLVAGLAFSMVSTADADVKTADGTILTAGLLTGNDFESGWSESPRSPSSLAEIDVTRYGKTCAALQKKVDVLNRRVTHRDSSNFKHGRYDVISDRVSVFTSSRGTRTALELLRRAETSGCMQRALSDQLRRQASSEGATIKLSIRELPVPQAGDHASGLELAVTISARGVTVPLFDDMQLVRVGRATVSFSFQGGTPSPVLAYQDLVQRVVSRVRSAQSTTT
jgi:hypothetical protein